MPDRKHTTIKRRIATVLGSAEDLLLSPGLRACDKTLGGPMILIVLESGKGPCKSFVTLECTQLCINLDRAYLLNIYGLPPYPG